MISPHFVQSFAGEAVGAGGSGRRSTPWRCAIRRQRGEHQDGRVGHSHPYELPAHRPAGPLRRREGLCGRLVDLVTGPDVDHTSPPVREAYEVVRRVPARTLSVVPVEPKRLRGHPHDIRIPVQQDQPVPFQPGLEPDQVRRGDRVVPAREAPGPLVPPEATNRLALLEPRTPPLGQRHPHPLIRHGKVQLKGR